ncbi:MAG: hypothetical protein R3C13_07885 [Hyphomonas sp.]|uniref:hypothetical protein n=1 Tax=Hyphomonas sp. TaxID=87 RepID=UPI003529196F
MKTHIFLTSALGSFALAGCTTDDATKKPKESLVQTVTPNTIERVIGTVQGGTLVTTSNSNDIYKFSDADGNPVTGDHLYGYVRPDFTGFDTSSGVCPREGVLGALANLVSTKKSTAGLSLEVKSSGAADQSLVKIPLLAMTYDAKKGCRIETNSGGQESPYFNIGLAGGDVLVSVDFWETSNTSSDLFSLLTEIGTASSNEQLAGLASDQLDKLLNRFLTSFDIKESQAFSRRLTFSADEGPVEINFKIGDVAKQSSANLTIDLGTRSSLLNVSRHQHPPVSSVQPAQVVLGIPLGSGETILSYLKKEFGTGNGSFDNWQATEDEKVFMDGCRRLQTGFVGQRLNRWDRALVNYAMYEVQSNRDDFDFTHCFQPTTLQDLEKMGVGRAVLEKK